MAAVKNEMIRCIQCKHGTFMQWFKNPIICKCHVFDEKMVAESKHLCDEYEERSDEPEIEHFDHY